MRAVEHVTDTLTGQRRKQKNFVRSLQETAARAVVTATVTFTVGWVLKKMFVKSVAQAAKAGAEAGAENQASETGGGEPSLDNPA